MKRPGRPYHREFKISVVAELESVKPLAQIAREHGIHPSLPSRWGEELAENPEKAFSGNEEQVQGQGQYRRTGKASSSEAHAASSQDRQSILRIMDLNNQIQRIALEFPGYGCRKIRAEL